MAIIKWVRERQAENMMGSGSLSLFVSSKKKNTKKQTCGRGVVSVFRQYGGHEVILMSELLKT